MDMCNIPKELHPVYPMVYDYIMQLVEMFALASIVMKNNTVEEDEMY